MKLRLVALLGAASLAVGLLGVWGAAPPATTRAASRPATATTTAPDPAASFDAPKDGMGRVNRAAALREIMDYSPAGMNRRLGPDYSVYHKKDAAPEKFPDIYLVPPKPFGKGTRHYQIGGPYTSSGGDFSSTQGQILYVPDKGIGVERVTIIEWSNGCFIEKPEPPWHGGFGTEPTAGLWSKVAGNGLGMPLAAARGMGGWSNCGVIVFSSGFLGTAGTVTGHANDPYTSLPRNKVPTAISITNKSEFALVTVIDTDRMKGQVAVFALQGGGKKAHFAHEWHEDLPGAANVGWLTDMKLLGYIDLPDMALPTGICAVGNHTGGRLSGRDGNAGRLAEYDLNKQEDRDVFNKGGNGHYASSAGYAVVISKFEGKVTFIDLQPLFAKIRDMYFTTAENFKKSRDVGKGPKQWPYTFDADPTWKPAVIKTLDVQHPTAVIAPMDGKAKGRALVASRDGTLTLYSVGGLATEDEAKAEDIAEVGTTTIGHNPVWLAYTKGNSSTVLAVSRGDREIEWIKIDGDNAEVTKRLRDNRLIDPVYLEVADTHGISTSLLTVADFKGKKILNYRYSQLVFATQGGAKFGMGAKGDDEFECGGTYEFAGYPFVISASNVN